MATTTDDQGRFLGNDEVLYVTDTDPSAAPTNPTNYTKVGLLVNNPFSGDSAEVEAADKNTARFTSSLPGSSGYSVEVEANRPATTDAGQVLVRDAWLNGTKLWWLISTNTTGDECKHGKAVVTGYGEPSSTDEYVTVSATLSGQGAPTFTQVA